MKFIVKDLMVSVLPLRPDLTVGGCDAGACTGACSGCTPCSGGCSPCSDCSRCSTSTPGDILDWISHIYDPVVLARLKEQMRVGLDSVVARERSVHDGMRPSTSAEIDLLRQHLTGALEELNKKQPASK